LPIIAAASEMHKHYKNSYNLLVEFLHIKVGGKYGNNGVNWKSELGYTSY
jgi:hypothetical protein